MTKASGGKLRRMHRIGQAAAWGLLLGLTLALMAATALAVLGLLPWPRLALSYGEAALPRAGMWVQIGLTIFLAMLCLALPPGAKAAAAAAPGAAPGADAATAPEAARPPLVALAEAPPVFARPVPVPSPQVLSGNVVPLLRPAARTPAPVQPKRPGPRGRPP